MIRLPGRQDVRDATYLLLGLVLGVFWVALLGALQLSGIASKFAPIGAALFLGAQLLLRPIGRVERFLVRTLLRHDVPPPAPLDFRRAPAGRTRRLADALHWTLAVVRDGHSWRVLGWILIRFVTGPLGAATVVLYLCLPLLLLAPLIPLTGLLTGGRPWWLLLGPVAFVLAAPVLLAAVRGLAGLHRRLAVRTLGPGWKDVEAAVLARAVRAEEQVRIDQELHDSIGHMLSMIVVQAGAGAHVFDRDPEFARAALRTIEDRGRTALGELDRIIATFRADGPAAHSPLPGVEDIPALLSGAHEAGMRVRSRIRLGELRPAVGRGVYRLVQEALTNAAKHAPGSTVEVDLAADERTVALSVVNPLGDPGTAAESRGGTGLDSIRQRVALLGGRATAGPATGGTFAVRAVIPLGSALPEGRPAHCGLTAGCDCLGCSIRRTVLG